MTFSINSKCIHRDSEDLLQKYEPIAVIEFRGTLHFSGASEGHYICDVKDYASSQWFRTNDGRDPVPISLTEVSEFAYVVLYKRVQNYTS